MVGDGEVPDCILDCFRHLCRDAMPRIVVLCLDGESSISERRWLESGIRSVKTLDSLPADATVLTNLLLNADGVWIENGREKIAKQSLCVALLKNVAERNKVVALRSKAVSLLPQLDNVDLANPLVSHQVVSPLASSRFRFGQGRQETDKVGVRPGEVLWTIPNSTSMVIHHGRRVMCSGRTDVEVMVPAVNGWPLRRGSIERIDVFESKDVPSYSLDLFSWVRSGAERKGEVFPPTSVSSNGLEKGALFLHGGSGVGDDIMEEFIKIAGGKGAAFVCIPSASRFDSDDELRSYSAGRLQGLGCRNVTIVHASDPLVAATSADLLKKIENADAIWIDGGRTYRFMDCYENTKVPQLLREALQRGAVVGGSSAGCQVPSDFLVRGNPRSNRDMVVEGYTRGLGLLKGVIIDAHFRQRGREQPFMKLMKTYPQFLGIGIDERTALIVKGKTGRVIGPNAVSFYNLSGSQSDASPVLLTSGESFDFVTKKKK